MLYCQQYGENKILQKQQSLKNQTVMKLKL